MANLVRFNPYFRFPSIWDDEDDDFVSTTPTGLSISEDDKNVYVEAAVPGVDPKNIEVTFDKGTLWIKAEETQEEKEGRKVYSRRMSSYSYRTLVPGEIDQNKEPEVNYKNGLVHVAFPKSPASQPKKLTVKAG